MIGENETGFRGERDLLYRSEGWDFIIAGGSRSLESPKFAPSIALRIVAVQSKQ